MYLLSQNMGVEDRRTIEIDIIHEYLKTLYEYGVHDYSFEDVLFDYRICLLRRFGSLITTIAGLPFDKEQLRKHIDVLLPRITSAMLDHDCYSLLDKV